MRLLERVGRALLILAVFALASYLAVEHGTGGLWRGLEAAHAVGAPGKPNAPYDLTQLVAVNETLRTIRKKYVDPDRVNPRQMFLSALNQIQKEVAQVIVHHDENAPEVRVTVETEEQKFRIDNVQGPWDVAARLREVFAFLQKGLQGTDVDLREVEYAACNGMLRTLDPHSTFLSPEAFREMNLSTSGHFGGLGIVISIRDQMLTIMRPMPGTPAGRAGLKRLDRIMKINNESTLNMPLDDAVERLRGKPGSKVTVWIQREGPEGWTGARPFELTREEIRISSVDARMLNANVGYVRLKQFQNSTADELDEALDRLRQGGKLTALVLDLRGNPGGLLDQAAKVADKFIAKGIIVSTEGVSEGREEKAAVREGTEPDYPIVVITNGSSASASEIVAGALKNLDRAVVVGQTTFGKGTVQLVFPRVTPDGAALKLTIAQYLTPGDISIQGVGVTPDVELDPMTADPLEMDLFRTDHPVRERDLSESLGARAKRRTERPSFVLRYNMKEKERAELRDRGGELDDEFTLDFPIRFARDLAGRLTPGRRPAQLRAARAFLEQEQEQQMSAMTADLAALGVDWRPPPEGAPPGPRTSDFEVSASTDRKGNKVTAGQPMALRVKVKNKGKSTAYRLRAITKSDGGYYDEKELLFGRVDPGQTVTREVPLGWCDVDGRKPGSSAPVPDDARRTCKLPTDAVTRQDVVQIRFFADGGEAPADTVLRPTVTSVPRPVFAYAYQITDNRPGNGDGMLVRGEGATVYLTVKNVGEGRSYETQANLRNLTGDGLLLHAGRFDVSNMNPGDIKNVAFTFDVLGGLKDDALNLELSVVDRDLRVVSSEKLTIPVSKGGLGLVAAHGRGEAVADPTPVRGEPVLGAPVVGDLKRGSVVEILGTFAKFTKVRLDATRFGYVPSDLLRGAATTKRLEARFTPLLRRSPPLLDVSPAQLATRGESVRIEGVATDNDRVLDTYIFVGSRKVFYQSNRKAKDPRRLAFSVDAKLTPGINVISVVARETDDTVTQRTMVVRRDGPNGEPLPTPDKELYGVDWELSGDD
jgi:carboxyl-terminal processing protease